jgi:hypothetical protein
VCILLAQLFQNILTEIALTVRTHRISIIFPDRSMPVSLPIELYQRLEETIGKEHATLAFALTK